MRPGPRGERLGGGRQPRPERDPAARRGHDHARVHVHELRGPLPLRRGAHEGRHSRRRRTASKAARRWRSASPAPTASSAPRRTCRSTATPRPASPNNNVYHVPPPPGARDERRAQACPRGLERRRRRRGGRQRVGRHHAAAARRRVPDRVLHAATWTRPQITDRFVALASEFPNIAEIVNLPNLTNGYRRKAQTVMGVPLGAPVCRPDRQLHRRRGPAGGDPRVARLRPRGRQRPVRHVQQPGRRRTRR